MSAARATAPGKEAAKTVVKPARAVPSQGAATNVAAETPSHRGARSRARTRTRLVEAARRVIARKGVDATTIAEITDEADVGFGSFYNHFASKEAIVEAVIEAAVEAHGSALDRLTAPMPDPAEVMATSIRHTVRMVERDPIWGWFVVRTAFGHESLRGALGRRANRDLEAGRHAGRFRVDEPRVALIVLGGAVVAFMRARLEGVVAAGDDAVLAEQILVLFGVPAGEAHEIARRPLPPVPEDPA